MIRSANTDGAGRLPPCLLSYRGQLRLFISWQEGLWTLAAFGAFSQPQLMNVIVIALIDHSSLAGPPRRKPLPPDRAITTGREMVAPRAPRIQIYKEIAPDSDKRVPFLVNWK